jgi:hypothetical protein
LDCQLTLFSSKHVSLAAISAKLQGFVRPLAQLKSEVAADPENQQAAELLKARKSYGVAELEFARAFHANTLRFQISQPALDPGSSLYDENHLKEVEGAIRTARRAGLRRHDYDAG